MKAFLALLALTSFALALPAKRVTNREFPDGGGSSKELDPEKRQATETFYDGARKPTHKVVYKLDERLQVVSGIYYNNAGRIFQKSAYRLDAADRIIQEVVYDANGKLVCTKNFVYGTRAGRQVIVATDIYDANGNLMPKPGRGGTQNNRRR